MSEHNFYYDNGIWTCETNAELMSDDWLLNLLYEQTFLEMAKECLK